VLRAMPVSRAISRMLVGVEAALEIRMPHRHYIELRRLMDMDKKLSPAAEPAALRRAA